MAELVDARVTLRVPRGGQTALREEARERLAGVPAVERVETFDVTGVRPGLNDLQVRARTTVACETDAATEVDAALEGAVGVEQLERLDSESER
jgi:hypothetical protein